MRAPRLLVTALLLAHLAVPTELLQPLGLDRIADRLQATDVVLGHSLCVCTLRTVRPPSLELSLELGGLPVLLQGPDIYQGSDPEAQGS